MNHRHITSPACGPGNAEVTEIRVPRDDEPLSALLEQARLAGLMYAHNGRCIALVQRDLPGWREIFIRGKDRRAA